MGFAMRFILVTNKPWHDDLFNRLCYSNSNKWDRITSISQFNYEYLNELNPDWVFIPHWSHIIPATIFENFRCVVFHMTDLPFGRGGSPLQNLIVRGFKETKISAIRVTKGIDTGDIYIKKTLDLSGSARDIFNRSSSIVYEMIQIIINNDINPKPQIGNPVLFKRRAPSESDISKIEKIEVLFDYIRMLDCEGYPNAFLENDKFRFEFNNAKLDSKQSIIANVRITKK